MGWHVCQQNEQMILVAWKIHVFAFRNIGCLWGDVTHHHDPEVLDAVFDVKLEHKTNHNILCPPLLLCAHPDTNQTLGVNHSSMTPPCKWVRQATSRANMTCEISVESLFGNFELKGRTFCHQLSSSLLTFKTSADFPELTIFSCKQRKRSVNKQNVKCDCAVWCNFLERISLCLFSPSFCSFDATGLFTVFRVVGATKESVLNCGRHTTGTSGKR